MAKTSGLDEIFKRTEQEPGPVDNSDLDAGNIQATGIGLRQGELAALDGIAGSLSVTRNQLLRYAVRYFLLAYRAGRLDLAGSVEEPPPPKKKLKLPGG